MKNTKRLLALALAGSMMFAFAGCGSASSAPAADSGDAAADSATGDTLVLATSADYPPYEFHKLIDGKDEIVGFDISLAQLIADKLGKKLEIRDISFDSCLIELNMDKADIVIAGMSPDPDRDAAFSDIYYDTTQCVLVRKADSSKYTDVASLAGQTIGAQLGSAQEKAAKAELPDSNLVSLQKIPDLLLNLSSGKSEAVVMEKFVAKTYLQTYDDMLEVNVNCGFGYDINCEVVCENGVVNLPCPSFPTVRYANEVSTKIEDNWILRFIDSYDVELQDWVDHALKGETGGSSAWDGYVASITADALVKSQTSGVPEKVVTGGTPDFYKK